MFADLRISWLGPLEQPLSQGWFSRWHREGTMDACRVSDVDHEGMPSAKAPWTDSPPVTEAIDEPYAFAEGLSATEAYTLSVWLREMIHRSQVEVIDHGGESFSVRWRR